LSDSQRILMSRFLELYFSHAITSEQLKEAILRYKLPILL